MRKSFYTMIQYGLLIGRTGIGILNIKNQESFIGGIHFSIHFLIYSQWKEKNMNHLYPHGWKRC